MEVPLQSHSSLPGAPPPLPYIAGAPAPGSPPKGAAGTPPDKQQQKKMLNVFSFHRSLHDEQFPDLGYPVKSLTLCRILMQWHGQKHMQTKQN